LLIVRDLPPSMAQNRDGCEGANVRRAVVPGFGWLRAGLVALTALLLVVACSDGDEDPTSTITLSVETSTPTAEATSEATSDATTEATAEATAAPTQETAAGGATEYPLTVRDLMGREVTIEAAPASIVAASPSAIEMLYAAGGTAVARSETAVHPDGVEALPSIGLSYQPAFEQIIALQPDLVLADASAQAHLLEAFEGALQGVPIVFVGAVTYEDVAASIRLIGQITDTATQADAAAASMQSTADEVAAAIEGMPAPRVLILNGGTTDYFVALPDSFVGNLAAHVSVENVADGLPQAGRFPGYTQLSPEAILEANPDVILAITAGGPSLAEYVLGEAVFAGVAAVQNARVFELDLEVYLQAPGPRAADGLRELALLLYGIE
jgi:iron complex transport system substrate-binding protein